MSIIKRMCQACFVAPALFMSVIISPPALADHWVPWAFSWDKNGATQQHISPQQGLSKIKTTSLWSPDGELLVVQLVSSKSFKKTVELLDKDISSNSNPELIARYGTLLTYGAYMSEDEGEMAELAARADVYFDQALSKDKTSWGAWLGKATLYGFSHKRDQEASSIKILKSMIEAQQKTKSNWHHVYPYLVLGAIYEQKRDFLTAKEIWTEGLQHFPNNEALHAKMID
ncbi:hypothetical protein PsAD46_01427 [Pseudovibrio sp. Ad46]|nr:hypothetical protein PsAD46_01427 [Pseudovibrio sp. Ad46]KZL01913.1 hypothetical protein PsAD5_00165 [Pseudovibrio sp. Ad5]